MAAQKISRAERAQAREIQQSAWRGNIFAQVELAKLHYEGSKGLAHDRRRAWKWMKRALATSHGGERWWALFEYGKMHYDGTHGFRQDRVKAWEIFYQAPRTPTSLSDDLAIDINTRLYRLAMMEETKIAHTRMKERRGKEKVRKFPPRPSGKKLAQQKKLAA